MHSHMWAPLAIWGQRRSVGYEWIYMINFYFLCPLLLLLVSPIHLTTQFSPDSLLLFSFFLLFFWQLFLMLTKPPLDSILLLDCGFSSPAITPHQAHTPLLLILISKLRFVSSDGVTTGTGPLCS